VFEFEGTKPSDFTVNSVYIHIEGNEFWRALEAMFGSAMLTTAKLALYPLKIVVGKRYERHYDRIIINGIVVE